MANKVQKRKYVIGLLVLLAMATVSTYAWEANTLTTDPSKVYVTSNPTTDYSIGTYSVKVLGTKTFRIYFAGTGAAHPNVQFTFLASDGTAMTLVGTATVKLYDVTNSTTCQASITADTDHVYTTKALTNHSYYIDVTGTAAIWNNLDGSSTAYQGTMFVIP